MRQDRFGNKLATSGPAADAYGEGLDLFLGANFGAVEAFEAALAEDARFARGWSALGRARMMGGDMAGAQAALAEAQRLGGDPAADIFALLLAGRAPEARRAAEAHVADAPRDALVAQLCVSVFGLIGFSGCTAREVDQLAYTAALVPHYGEEWWMMSAHGVSLCETGQLEPALQLIEASLALNPRNSQAAHFKAHTLYEMGETGAGRAYLAAWMQGYDRRSLIHGHLRWHEALWALHAGDADAMWAAVDDGVTPKASSSLPLNALTDTAAIYHRAELAGHAVDPARWAALSDYAAARFANPGQSFADLHAALAHAMAGQGARLARLAEAQNGFAADLVRPAAAAWGHIARQDWAEAEAALQPVMAHHARLGGSRAQRDLLELTWANVLLRQGKARQAHRALRARPALGPNAPLAVLH
ncbi:MAG: tetratricopeptide repeat protein [Pseudomonadota bacterium]